ncbi:hypothetical protein DN752_09065 [Echinicola strongylocentroti]|uniref:Uncharacterized protein n=1 Tax=Echinicola strongylocentroti TaxID=1795355 RepID=A0A2Z4IGH4_9BACT|nr:hypothetical protein DN752_09065 [Echinicola strongylocentroti]
MAVVEVPDRGQYPKTVVKNLSSTCIIILFKSRIFENLIQMLSQLCSFFINCSFLVSWLSDGFF